MFIHPKLIACTLGLLAVSACEMPNERYVDLLTRADSSLTAKQDRLRRDFNLGAYGRYDYDEATGAFVLSDSGFARVIADAQFVGEVSRRDSVWTWAWELPAIPSRLAIMANAARWYGWRHRIRLLRESGWHAEEVDGWEMTSLTSWIGDADGAYRAPSSDSSAFVFLLLTKVRWAPPGQRVESLIRSPRSHE